MQRTITLMAILFAVLLPVPVWAQPTEIMCHYEHNPVPFFARKMVLIAASISERPSREPGVFYRNWIELDYHEGQAVLLTGSRTLGAYHTDDLVRVTVSPSGKSWEHDFRSADRLRIVPREAFQDLTDMLEPGINTIEIVLEDLLGPVYSSANYWILVMEPCPQTVSEPTGSVSGDALLSATAPRTLTVTPTVTPTTVAQGVALSEGPISPTEPDAELMHETATPQPTASPVQAERVSLVQTVGIGLSLALLLLGFGLWQGRRLVLGLAQELVKQLAPAGAKARALLDAVKAWLKTL